MPSPCFGKAAPQQYAIMTWLHCKRDGFNLSYKCYNYFYNYNLLLN